MKKNIKTSQINIINWSHCIIIPTFDYYFQSADMPKCACMEGGIMNKCKYQSMKVIFIFYMFSTCNI